MIPAALIKLSAALLCVGGLTDGSDVTQTPQLWTKEGQSATMNCNHSKNFDYNQMYWYQQLPGQNMKQIVFTTDIAPHQYEEGFSKEKFPAEKKDAYTGSLTVKELQPEDSGVYFCAVRQGKAGGYEAYFGRGTKLTVLDRNIEISTPTVRIFQPSKQECKDQGRKKKMTLVCVASGFYPDHVFVFWHLNGLNVTDGVATDAAAKRDGQSKMYSITSRLRVPAETWLNPTNKFSCIVTFYNGTNYTDYPVHIQPNETDTGMTRELYLKISQNAKLSYSVLIVKSCLYGAFVCFLVWKLQGKRGKQTK